MIKTTGIGGFFFRARDKDALGAWYKEHLGVGGMWTQQAGMTLLEPFRAETDYFPADKQWMINFRVENLDDAMRYLKSVDIVVETRAEWDTAETGRFARIHDPEGNQIELWEPPAAMR